MPRLLLLPKSLDGAWRSHVDTATLSRNGTSWYALGRSVKRGYDVVERFTY